VRIAIFGAGGEIARRIAREALSRGHAVTGVVRSAKGFRSDNGKVLLVEGDATDAASVARAAKGADVIVNALSPRPSPSGRPASSLAKAAHALIEGARAAGVPRLIVVGGAGTLETASGQRLIDSPGFPEAYKPESLEGAAALEVYRTAAGDLDWTYISPAAEIGAGERRGHYRSGDDTLLVDERGRSNISYDDYALALVDEIETPTHPRARMTVAY
jgi:putative NADH-flavin reductase